VLIRGLGFAFEFSSIGDGPAVLGVSGEPDAGQQGSGVGSERQLEQDIAEPGPGFHEVWPAPEKLIQLL
jgi:hypothetical protein